MPDNEIVIERFVFEPIRSNMYIILASGEAIVIDPHVSPDADKFLSEGHVKTVSILLTHEHFDHTSGVNWLKEKYSCQLICTEECAQRIANKRNNRPLTLPFLKNSKEKQPNTCQIEQSAWYECIADKTFQGEYSFVWHGHKLKLISAPGHTIGSCLIELDQIYVFTGDSLIADSRIITRFPTGSHEDYEKFTLPYLQTIPSNSWIMPGHGKPFKKMDVVYSDGWYKSFNNTNVAVE